METGRPTNRVLAIVKLALPLVGLSILPLGGLVYAATTSFGPTNAAAASGSPSASGGALINKRGARASGNDSPSEDDAMADPPKTGTPSLSVPTVRPTAFGRTGPNNQAPRLALCCEKLRDMQLSAPATEKISIQAAIGACSSANSLETISPVIKSTFSGLSREAPPECSPK